MKTTLSKATKQIRTAISEIINRDDLSDKTKHNFIKSIKWDLWLVENDNFLKRDKNV